MPLTRRNLPLARHEGMLVEHVGDETVIYDSKTKEAHCLSPLAAVVFAQCDGRTRVKEIAAATTERLGEPVDDTRVMDALAQLEERALLAAPARGGLSRRDMFQKSAAAAGGVAAVPLITSIVAPAAIAAQTCDVCGTNLLSLLHWSSF